MKQNKKADFSVNQIGIVILIIAGLVLALFVMGIFGKQLFEKAGAFFRLW